MNTVNFIIVALLAAIVNVTANQGHLPQTVNHKKTMYKMNGSASKTSSSSVNPDYWCGADYWDAFKCHQACPSGDPASCPGGMGCYSGVSGCTTLMPPPAPASPASTAPPASVMGYYQQEWLSDKSFPSSNLGVCFSGYNDVNAITECEEWLPKLVGTKYISFGGGNHLGVFTTSVLDFIDSKIKDGSLKAYKGICYDVEEGSVGLDSKFEASFKLAKQYGFEVFVTVSRSAPYGITPPDSLMTTFFNSKYIDYISPQLYGSGTTPEYIPSWNYPWAGWAECKVPVVASIVDGKYYGETVSFLQSIGVTPVGWVKWQ